MRDHHFHDIEYIWWDNRVGAVHQHSFSTPTSFDDGHQHVVQGTTKDTVQGMDQHVHSFEGQTTLDDGHVHYFREWTGPPIIIPNRGHYHEFSGMTTYNDGHSHSLKGATNILEYREA
ncbi:hypothetical protein JOC86_000035 [Bacillus pakistanensis]|uniref:YmaF family protein n=1 Tax=Rossellomorea pakistanensis TaxID=992288 RepID=A0ABS2N6N0_9BACI|nr:YmaF family protein [Bacillus pakistanensis]MBM7583498.1 hypothetical protein [Bacillus pakistanensis]